MTREADLNPPARSDDRPGPRVTAVLESLALQRASGVLEIDGNPAGAIYLDRGQITYAQASWVPDLAARFCASRQPPAEVRALLLGGDHDTGGPDGPDLGAVLLRCVTREELTALLRSVIVDAILALTVPMSGDIAVSGIRFEAPRPHWASAFAGQPLDSVREEAACRAARIARYQVTRTATVALRDLDQGPVVLTREEWAIASRIGRTSTVRDLAWRSGLSLCDTIEYVGRLIWAGVCTLGPGAAAAGRAVSAAGPESGGAADPAAGGAAAPAAGGAADPAAGPAKLPAPGVPEPLPRRQPGTHLARQLNAAAGEGQPGSGVAGSGWPAQPSFTPPPPDVLHRLLKGLRNLS